MTDKAPLEIDKYFAHSKKVTIGVIGLGYVGLPLAIEFAKKYKVVGFDVDVERIADLQGGKDITGEANLADLKSVLLLNQTENIGLEFSSNSKLLKSCNIFIITVPTSINKFKSPDLTELLAASKMVGEIIKKDDVVIFESTVYPGCTEEDCVPALEHFSGLKLNSDFYVGYSPERINPGDKLNTLTTIKKVTSGSNPISADLIDELYSSIITAGTYRAQNIKVAEASKAIENAQRDINISFVNELALIFDKMGIDTQQVLDAASTKWNFLNYKPGLVGGHCISVDPYYLAYKAQALGYYPQVILSGRRVNDNMGSFVASKVIKLMIKKGHTILGSKALVLGFTFKQNCPDIRNTKVIDIYKELRDFGIVVDVYDPWASPIETLKKHSIELKKELPVISEYNAIIIAVAHQQFLEINFANLKSKHNMVLFDIKSCIDKEFVDARL